jgi:NADH:ubiquinone oxidoreductase subunit 6 (subunit J)
MDWDLIVFLFVAAVSIVSAIYVIRSKEIVRSVMWLALCFMTVGFTFIFLNAEYLALIQILVYVGAVCILIAFGIMLTKRRLLGGDRQ